MERVRGVNTQRTINTMNNNKGKTINKEQGIKAKVTT